MTRRDYYEILGVSRDCDDGVLKTAYRKLALQYHPDRNPENREAEDRFKEAAEAYSILSNGQKRAVYDRYGHQGLQGAGAASQGFDPDTFQDFSDILGDFFGFGDLFGGGSRRSGNGRSRQRRGEDLRYDLEITLEEAIRGMSAEIMVPRAEQCSQCGGAGGEGKDGLTQCSTCRGRGEVIMQQGFLSIRQTCRTCGGRGQLVRKACSRCSGEGYIRADRKLKVTIPPGVDRGTRLRMMQEGQAGANGGPPGDLYVVIQVKEHPVFERRENDLHCIVGVNIAQAALGSEVDILTFEGLEHIKIPDGVQTGEQIRVRGRGVPFLNSHGRGDLIVNVQVKVPTRLNREQRKLLEQLRETLPTENEPQERGLFEKVKDIFS